MANIDNPRKQFNFSIQVVGAPINPFLVQKVTISESSISEVKHGDVNYDVKTPGRVETGNTTLEKLMTTSGSDMYMWNWHKSCQDDMIGGGLPPQSVKRNLIVNELAEDGTSALNTWLLSGCWPSKIDGLDLDRKGTDNTIEKVTMSVDRIEKV